MTGPRNEQILSQIAAVDVAIYLISKAKSAVSDLPQKKRGRTQNEESSKKSFENFREF